MDNYILLITKNNIWNNKFVSTTISLSEVQLAAICTMLYSMFKDEVEDYTKIVYNEFSVPIIDNSLEPVLEGVKAYRTSDVSEIDYQDRFIFKTDDNTSWYQCNEEFLNACKEFLVVIGIDPNSVITQLYDNGEPVEINI